jgi:FkbM family methyltransferase
VFVPAPEKPLAHRFARYIAWKGGEAIANTISAITGFHTPDDPLHPFAQKLPMVLGRYEAATWKEIRKLVRPGMVVIDGGAHVGYMTRRLSKLVGSTGKVLAFEINPANLALLRRNTRNLANVEIIPAALGDHDGTAKIYLSAQSSGHSATPSKPGLTPDIDVPMRSVASVLKERGLERVDFLKLDIEGGEPAVLRSLPEGSVAVVFEVKRYILEAGGETPEGVLKELIEKGFTVRREGRGAVSATFLGATSALFDKANIVATRDSPTSPR